MEHNFVWKGATALAKRKKVIRAGNLVLATIHTPPMPRDEEHVRAEKSKMTTASRRALNFRTARRRLELLLATNFTARDLHMTLTYRDACLPKSRAEAAKNLRKFIDHLRKHRKQRGQVLKYVYTTEGNHGDKRWHHHVVVNATDRDIDVFRSLWIHGDQVDIEYIADREYKGLAEYLTKESIEGKPVGAQMWTPSRNLQRPVVESSWVDDNETLTVPPGCYVLERQELQNEFGSFSYIKYRIEPVPQRKTRPSRAKRARGASDIPVMEAQPATEYGL